MWLEILAQEQTLTLHIALAAIAYFTLMLTLEKYKLKGTYEIKTSFNGTAEVFIEDNGVARIVADNELAALYASGYVLASNRLWQMEYLKRLAQGRMSEIFGKGTVPLDEAFRTLGLKHV